MTLEVCPNCGNILEVRFTPERILICRICGWSENKPSDNKEVDYCG